MVQLEFKEYQPLFSDLSPRIVEQFITYHKTHPLVFEIFTKYAHEARRRWSHFSAKAICERMRWEMNLSIDGEFKLNNNFPSCYARLLIFEDKSFGDFFEIRRTPGTVERAA